MSNKKTTKECPNCGNIWLGRFPSTNEKYCADCHTLIEWYLEEGQKSPYTDMIGGNDEDNRRSNDGEDT